MQIPVGYSEILKCAWTLFTTFDQITRHGAIAPPLTATPKMQLAVRLNAIHIQCKFM